MAQQSRILQKIFGSTGGTSEFGRIGSEAAGSPTTTKDLDNIQSLSQYLQGLYAITASANEPPRIQDINALYFLITSQLSYLGQVGIPAYLATEEYYINSVVIDSNGDFYISLTGTDGSPNQGNTPSSSPSNWRLLVNNAGALNTAVAGEINAMSEKTSVVDADEFVIEDSADSNNKKKVLFSTIRNYVAEYLNNYIINPEGAIAQRGITITAASLYPNNDDTYTLDQWILLSDGNDIVDVSRDTDAPTRSKYAIKSLVATANKKWGFLQIIESGDSLQLEGAAVSLSFQAKVNVGSNINNIRVGILSWDSTADTVTSDVVSAWNASGTNPTLVANWTYENTPSNLTLTSSYQEFKIENISIDTSGMTNIALFIWVDDVDASVNDELYLSQIQLIRSNHAIEYNPRKKSEEIILCQRYFEKSYDIDTTPGTVVGLGQYNFRLNGLNSANHSHALQVVYKVQKMKIPTVICYNPTTGTAGQWQVTGGARVATASNIGEYAFNTELDLGGASDDAHYYGHYTIEAVL